jgi:HK97 gp10 family phage protein
MFALRVDGGEELARTLRAMPDRMSARIVGAALKKAAAPIRDATAAHMARSQQPHARGTDPNDGARGESHAADHVGITLGRSGHSVAIGPAKDWWYWLMQEYGTVHVPAQPALRPAFDTQGVRALGILGQELWKALSVTSGAPSSTTRSDGGGGGLL